MILAAALLAAAAQQPPLPEGNAFVRGLLQRQRQDEDALDEYAYDLLRVRDELRDDGSVKKRRSRRFEVFHVKGRPVRKLVAEDDHPLSPARQAREDRRVHEMVEAIRGGRVVVEEPHRRLSRLLEGFDFRSVAREELAGRSAVVVEFAPQPRAGGAAAPGAGTSGIKDLEALRQLSGRLWADEAEGRIVKIEVHNDARIRVGLGIGASISALAFTAEFRRVEDAVWLPSRVETWATGRVLVFKGFRVRHTDEYSRYRRFQVDSEEQLRPQG